MRLASNRHISVALWTVFWLTSPRTDARKPSLTTHIFHQKTKPEYQASTTTGYSDGTSVSKPGTGIPRILHQTYNTSDIPGSLKQNMESWSEKNPGWDMRFYNDTQCLELVERNFPQYAPAYKALSKPVERADFFRYMVVLSQGGFYADLDTNCWKPMDSIMRPEDKMLAGWEDEFSTFEAKERFFFGRQRQVLQWLFGAVAGHPVLRDVCDRIANASGDSFSKDTNADTEERTGPGVWTDVVLQHALAHPPKDYKGYLRLLPRTVWGALPKDVTYNPNRVSLHYSLGSWKVDEAEAAQQRKYTPQEMAFHEDFAKQLFPVSIDWEPPFTMLVPIKKQGDRLSDMDVAKTLTLWGGWHYPTFLVRQPTVAEALLGHFGPSQEKQEVLLDIGAGNGYFSLAAAALGHRALAFELAPKSVASFIGSVSYNGFEHLITLKQVALGRRKEAICLDPWLERSHEGALGLDVERGYGLPQLHAPRRECKKRSIRRPARSMLPWRTRISAIRISVTGWEGWILESLKDVIMRSQPRAIMVEFYPDLVEGMGFPGGAQRIFDMLTSWGYAQAQHMGYQCVEQRLTSLRLREPLKDFSDQDAVKQPGWCGLPPGGASQLISAGDQKVPEILLFQRAREIKVPEFWLTEDLSKP